MAPSTTLLDLARAAGRSLRRHPLHGAGVASLLALGLGAVMAVTALADRLVLHPVPYPDPGRVVAVYGVIPGFDACQFNAGSFDQLARGTEAFEALAALDAKALVLGQGEDARPVAGARVTRDFFPVLGVRPLWGRLAFTAEEDRWGGPGAVVVTEEAWRRRHGADPDLVGRSLLLDGLPRTVIGILPRGVNPPRPRIEGAAYYLPAAFSPAEQAEQGNQWDVVGRLRRDLGLPQAAAALRAFAATRTVPGRTDFRASPVGFELARRWRGSLGLFAGAALLVLLLAGINAASLVLARTEGRRAELAVHSALGASRSRLAGLLVMEGAFTAGAGFLLALPAAWVLRGALARQLGLGLPPPFRVPAFLGAGLGLGAVLLLASVLPAFAASRTDPAEVLKRQARGVARGSRRWVLVVELGLATALLVGSGLLLHSLFNLARLPTGLHGPEAVLAGTLTLPEGDFPGRKARERAFTAILARLQALPGVTHAALTQTAPFYKVPGTGDWRTPGGRVVNVHRHFASGDVPGALGIGLLAGRMPRPGEEACALGANLAERYWPGGDGIGRTLTGGSRRLVVVGLLAPTAEEDPGQGMAYQVWIPLNPELAFLDVFLRSKAAPGALERELRLALRQAAPGAQLLRAAPLSVAIGQAQEAPRKVAWVLGFLGAMALALAGAGVYGVASQLVLSRRREFGIRLALGATPWGLARLVLDQALRMTVMGLATGLAGSVWIGLMLKHLLTGVGGLDPASWVGGALILLVAVLAASLVPAFRAARTHPAEALRAE